MTVPSGITAKNKNYDGTTDAALDFSGAVISGKIAGDDVSVTGTGTFETEKAGVNRKVFISGLALTGADAGSYELASAGNQTETTAVIYNLNNSGDDSGDSWSGDTPGHWNQYGNIWTYTFRDGSPGFGSAILPGECLVFVIDKKRQAAPELHLSDYT